MTSVRKIALTVFPALALALPLAVASGAQAHEVHHDHFEHHDHHVYLGIYPRFEHRVIVENVAPYPLGVTVAPVNLFYRAGPSSPWFVYGSFAGVDDAQLAAQNLQVRGYQVYIR
jgi:hypothetical protein